MSKNKKQSAPMFEVPKLKVDIPPFRVQSMENGDVLVSTISGWRLRLPHNSMMAAHYIQAIADHDNDLLEKLAAKDYAVTTIVPDTEFYTGLLELVDSYMKRNGVSEISKDADDAILDEEKEYNDALNELMEDGER